MLKVISLPARQGDAFWIEWGDVTSPHRLLIDCGTPATGSALFDRIARMAPDQRKFELVIVTHIDSDHIGGVLTAFAEAPPLEGLDLKEVWFNGYIHLSGVRGVGQPSSALESMGELQGERLGLWLLNRSWNTSFGGNAVCRTKGIPPQVIELAGGLKLTVLGPTPERLAALSKTWTAEVHAAFAKRIEVAQPPGALEVLGSAPFTLGGKDDLALLANQCTAMDTSLANGSSIVVLLEYEGHKLLFAGDAYAQDLVEAIGVIVPSDAPLHVDLFKVPHHGSKQNVTQQLVESVVSDCWLISTDGTQFGHPDPEAIARILQFSRAPRPEIGFNTRSRHNEIWANEAWQSRFNYSTRFGSAPDGLVLSYG